MKKIILSFQRTAMFNRTGALWLMMLDYIRHPVAHSNDAPVSGGMICFRVRLLYSSSIERISAISHYDVFTSRLREPDHSTNLRQVNI